MNPALTISGNTSVVWQVAVRDSANKMIIFNLIYFSIEEWFTC